MLTGSRLCAIIRENPSLSSQLASMKNWVVARGSRQQGQGSPPGPSLPPLLSAMSRWLKDHQRLVLTVLVMTSLLLRLGYFLEISRGPCLWQHLWDQTDMNFFDSWARDIAAGDWLTNKSLHPHHIWHKLIAEAYFRRHPEAVSDLAGASLADGTRADAARVLWDRWYGGKTFHQEPLYPYLIALTYRAFGADVRWVFLWQLLLGVASNVLVYLIARRYFGEVVAAVAGLLAVLCGPLLFYEMILLRESLTTFMWLSLVYLTGSALARGGWRWWALTGLGCGLAILLRVTFLLYYQGVLGLLIYRQRGTPRILLQSLVVLVGGLVICLLPAVARNVAVGAPPLSLQSVGAIDFIWGNAEDYHPEPGLGGFISMHSVTIMDHTGGTFLPAATESLKTHPHLWSYLHQLWGKFAMIWHWYEFPDNANFYYYRLHSMVLRYLPVTVFLLAPLSLLGLALALGLRLSCGPLYLALASNVVTMLLIFVISRLRVPLLALLLPFAALALVQITGLVLARRLPLSAAALAALLLLSWWTTRPLPGWRPLIRPVDYQVAYFYYDRLVKEAIEKDNWARAAEILKDSLRFEPAQIRQMSKSFPAIDQDEARLASLYAVVHSNYALALQRSGQEKAALKEKQRALELLQAVQGNKE